MGKNRTRNATGGNMNVRNGQDARSLAFLTDIVVGVYVRRDVCKIVK